MIAKGEKKKFSSKDRKLLDEYIDEHPGEILNGLMNRDQGFRQRARELAANQLSGVDYNAIADDLLFTLEMIEVEELYESSGATRYGYVEPVERADEMFEDAVDPYAKELERCLKLSMHKEGMQHCMGILMGLYNFEKKASTEFQEWIPDTPREYFDSVLKTWSKTVSDPKILAEMDEFIAANCPQWHARKKNRDHKP